MEEMMNEKEYCAEGNCGGMDETIYEVEIDEESDIAEMMKEMEGLDEYGHMEEGHYEEGYGHMEEDMYEGAYLEEEEVEESTRRTRADRRLRNLKPSNYPSKKYESKRTRKPLINRKPKSSTVSETKIMKEYKELKSKNEEYKKALNVFKDKLNEVALFNTNLAYVNRLFTEHSTTKKEKMDILKRFDNAESIKESKNIYKTIKTELDNKQPINESIEKKVNKTIESSKATNLNESTAYVDPQITAIKDLMRRIS